jgi:hypothetical protein
LGYNETGTGLLSPAEIIAKTGLSRAHRPALLEAFPAKNRPPLGWPERDRGLLAALRAVGFGLRTHLQAAAVARPAAFGAPGFAGFASLGFVFETFVGEKNLFARGKYKLGAALRTLQDPIVIFHEALP